MNESTPPAILYYERLLPPILGLTREDVAYLRREAVKKGAGWWKQGREVVITEAGLENILRRLADSSNTAANLDFSAARVSPPSAPEKKEAPPAAATAGELVELKVKSLYPNPRMLRAFTPDRQVVDVRVRNNKNFVPGMALKARLGSGGKYDMEGRCPRLRGRY